MPRRSSLLARLSLFSLALCTPLACSDTEAAKTDETQGQTPAGETPLPTLGPGEQCASEGTRPTLVASVAQLHVAVGKSRTIDVLVQPDLCTRLPMPLSVANGAAAQIGAVGGAAPVVANAATATAKADLRSARIPVEIKGVAPGSTVFEASIEVNGKSSKVSVPVHVLDAAPVACAGKVSGKINPGSILGGTADLAGAELGLQQGADKPVQATLDGITYDTPTLWKVDAFDASVACSADIVPSGYVSLGPAVTFGPEDRRFQRDLPMAIPINPALFPEKAKLRHLRVAYSGPGFKAPRTVPVADPMIEKSAAGGWVLRFLAPRLGTYQAVITPDAGTRTFKRRLTHRAIIGVSMGGGGSALLGLRHHDKFDVVAPLGGPVDWTYMLDHIEKNHVAGFLPNDGENIPEKLAPLPEPRYPYEHPSSFNAWWYEYPREGNGGRFARTDYSQIFRDLSLMFGNPNGQNNTPGAEHLPPGVDPKGKAVQGDHQNDECTVWVESIDKHPDEAKQKELEQKCPAERCKYTQTIEKFYDRDFNSKGKWPVITVCDGSPQIQNKSPYANQWSPEGNNFPLEVALAVDYNGNGKRDENEPIIKQGHEPWSDVGADGKPSKDEAGYAKGSNEDPAGDDYEPQFNPSGTEGDGRFQQGEPFEDVGLDGVADTQGSPYDNGEGDGKFSVAAGLQRFWDQDAHSIVRQWVTPPGGPLDDAALKRVDLWTDGGYRDLFNFAVSAQHLVGTFAARNRDVAYYSRFTKLPGQNPDDKLVLSPQNMRWDELPGVVMMRYGYIDPTQQDLLEGSGQHVGTVPEVTSRLQSALYYIGTRWPDAPRTLVDKSLNDPAPGAPNCEITGTCNFTFKDSRGREGPVTVNLPPGYAHKDLQNVRYPVVFMLHGYGQTPEDLGAAIVFLGNWMNQGLDSSATRLGKAILVYVDGRCRPGPTGEAECIRGTFYADSPREKGGKLESWFLDLMTHIDQKYRTMGESEVEWTE